MACLEDLGKGGHSKVEKVHLCALGFSTAHFKVFFYYYF